MELTGEGKLFTIQVDERPAMSLATRLSRSLRDPKRSYERIRKVTEGIVRGLLPREAQDDIVMFHIGRSGSTVLGDMLNQHPSIFWNREVFNPVVKNGALDLEPAAFLAKRMRRAGGSRYGCEIKPVHMRLLDLDLVECLDMLSRLGFAHHIVLQRRNYLKKVVSSVVAHHTGAFHRVPSERRTHTQIALNMDHVSIDRDEGSLLEFLKAYDAFFHSLEDAYSDRRHLWLTYEDDVSGDPRVAYQKICRFVGVSTCEDATVRYARTNPYPLERIVSNFGDLEETLEGTGFEWMLRDDLDGKGRRS